MVIAAGSEAERRQLGQLSLKHRKALVDVGADYFRGHVQVCGRGPSLRYLTRKGIKPSQVQGRQMAKFERFLSLDCARVEGVGAQCKERKGLHFCSVA